MFNLSRLLVALTLFLLSMKIICPEHNGLIYVDASVYNEKNIVISKVVDCPVCDDLVLIKGVFDIDQEGLAKPAN